MIKIVTGLQFLEGKIKKQTWKAMETKTQWKGIKNWSEVKVNICDKLSNSILLLVEKGNFFY